MFYKVFRKIIQKLIYLNTSFCVLEVVKSEKIVWRKIFHFNFYYSAYNVAFGSTDLLLIRSPSE